MLLLSLILTFVLIFLAGMHSALWLVDRKRKNLYWSIGLAVLGLYHIISLIGKVTVQ